MNTKLTFKQSITAGAIAAAASVVINAVLFFIFHAAGILTDDIMIQPNQPLTIVPVIISSILPSIVGACVFFLFEKYATNGYKGFTILSIILLVLSFANPFVGIPNVTMGYGVVLNVMHVVVAVALLYFIKRAKK
ncbi:MAG: hypothetical protein RL204_1541 [Bacteroidota bacterium]|jgi:hypothetical protein